MINSKFAEIEKEFSIKDCKLIKYISKSVKIDYICNYCGESKSKLYKDFIKNKECRTCTSKKLREKPDHEYKSDDGQIWKPIIGGWISNLGNCKNVFGRDMTLCPEKFRYTIGNNRNFANRLVAEAFQIENYEKMNDEKYIVMHIDGDESNNKLENLKITTKSETNSINGKKSRQSDNFKEKILWNERKFEDIEKKVIPQLPRHVIYRNGEIWNGTRFLVFSEYGGYLNVCLSDATFKVHRLICYAFNPIEGRTYLFDYDDLEPNHKDGNTRNNNADNLEWTTRSEQMRHAYDTGLSKKVRNVLQYSRDSLEFIAEFLSIAEASRKTGEPEHRIREISQGKINNNAKFHWKFKNEDETVEYSKKYGKK